MDPATRVRLADGSDEALSNVATGMSLLGGDGCAYVVKAVHFQQDVLYTIKPHKGSNFVVGAGQPLVIKYSGNNRMRWRKDRRKWQVEHCDSKGQVTYQYVEKIQDAKDIRVEREMESGVVVLAPSALETKVNSYRQRCMLTRGVIKGGGQGEEMLDPYIVGLWLGDGDSSRPVITTADAEVVEYLEELCIQHGLTLTHPGLYRYYLSGSRMGVKGSNYVQNQLLADNLISNKHIPLRYLTTERVVRLRLLAGLIDSDGHLSRNCFEITQKRLALSEGIVTLCRSLGFSTSIASCQKGCLVQGKMFTGEYFRICIFGSDLDTIPVLLHRKKALPRRQAKDALRTSFELSAGGEGPVIKLEMGCDTMMLHDFTVVKT